MEHHLLLEQCMPCYLVLANFLGRTNTERLSQHLNCLLINYQLANWIRFSINRDHSNKISMCGMFDSWNKKLKFAPLPSGFKRLKVGILCNLLIISLREIIHASTNRSTTIFTHVLCFLFVRADEIFYVHTHFSSYSSFIYLRISLLPTSFHALSFSLLPAKHFPSEHMLSPS